MDEIQKEILKIRNLVLKQIAHWWKDSITDANKTNLIELALLSILWDFPQNVSDEEKLRHFNHMLERQYKIEVDKKDV